MADLSVELTIPNGEQLSHGLQQFLLQLSDDIKDKAVTRAISRTMQAMRAEAARIARKEYTAHPNPLFDVRMRKSGMSGAIIFRGKPGYSLFHFKPRPNKFVPARSNPAGISTQILRSGGREVRRISGYDKPFIMPLSKGKSGKVGIFMRQSHGKHIEFQFGPSPIQSLIAERNKERLQLKVDETFPKRLQHEIDVLIAGTVR